jgi:hypothetical protein
MIQLSQQISQQLFMFGNGSSCANNSFTCTRTSARAHARVPRCMKGPICVYHDACKDLFGEKGTEH